MIDQTHIFVNQNLTMIYQLGYVELWPRRISNIQCSSDKSSSNKSSVWYVVQVKIEIY